MTAPSPSDTAPLPARSRRLYLIPGLAALLVAALFTLAGLGLSRSHETQVRAAERNVLNLASALEERVRREFESLDTGLRLLAARCQLLSCTQTDEPTARLALAGQLASLPAANALSVLDRQGTLVNDTSVVQVAPLNLSDRDFFRAHLPQEPARPDAPGGDSAPGNSVPRDSALFVGKPVVSHSAGTWSFSASRRLLDAEGNFAGVLVANIEPAYFQSVLGSVDTGAGGAAVLLHRNGAVLARVPHAGNPPGSSFALPQIETGLRAPGMAGTFTAVSPIDGVERIFALGRGTGAPIAVAVGVSGSEVLAPWFGSLKLFAALALLVSGMVAWLTARLMQEHEAGKSVAAALERNKSLFRQVLDALPVGVWVANPQGRILVENKASRRIWGGDPTAQAERLFRARWPGSGKLLSPNEWGLMRALRIGEVSRNETVEIENADGRRRTILHSAAPVLGWDKSVVGAIAVNEDVTERRTLVDQLRETEGRFVALFEKNIDAMLLTRSDGTVLRANSEACKLLGYGEDELRTLPPNAFVDPEDLRLRVLMVDRFVNGHAKGELTMVRKDHTRFPVELSTASFRDRTGEACASVTMRDITERKRAEEHIEYLAYHDELTGIRNRTYFHRALEQAISMAQKHSRSCGLMLVDLDRFKNINDSLGHQAGDTMLKEIAGRLRACVRDSDVVARLGGDEFIVLVQDVAGPESATPIARKILQSVCRPLVVNDRDLLVTASIGISFFPGDGADAQTLLKHADSAMYRAKESGKNAFQFFSSEMHATTMDRLALESGLHRALERDEFIMYYQPRMRVASRSVAGVEALIRWQHPERGLINPNEFISIAEETGLIVPVGDWVLENSCRYGCHLRDNGHPELSLSVNLSARQLLDARLADRIGDILERTGFPASALELEITESMVMHDADRAVTLLEKLRSTGVGVAIDDFGTGYSSLAYLKRFPINCVKIDRSFIRDLPRDRGDGAITRSIIAIAQNMKLNVVAEGVEQEQQLEFLNAYGCQEAQGFLFSAPLPPPTLETYLEQARAA